MWIFMLCVCLYIYISKVFLEIRNPNKHWLNHYSVDMEQTEMMGQNEGT
jgi:hypothetical protein